MNIADVQSHYTREGLLQVIDAALLAAGQDPMHPDPVALAAVDQFHVRGLRATEEMFERAAFPAGARVLDLGCGIGGAARLLAARYGCKVAGLDLTGVYVEVATELTRRTGQGEQVRFRQGDALHTPFDDRAFDGVYTQHMNMNIADKAGLVAEIRRVLRPGGRLALYEVVAGDGGPLRFPVPWARSAAQSALVHETEFRKLVGGEGLLPLFWEDQTAAGIAFFSDVLERARTRGLPPVGLHLLLGADAQSLFSSMLDNLQQDRIRVVMAVMQG